MEIDMYFLTSYLHTNFLIPPSEVTLARNFRIDFGMSRTEIDEMLEYLEVIFNIKFPARRAPDRYEYVLDLVFYLILYDDFIKDNTHEDSFFY